MYVLTEISGSLFKMQVTADSHQQKCQQPSLTDKTYLSCLYVTC